MGRGRTSRSSRILGDFSHFGRDLKVWAETQRGGVVEVSLCTAEGGCFEDAPAREERAGDGRRWGILGGMGKTNAPLLT